MLCGVKMLKPSDCADTLVYVLKQPPFSLKLDKYVAKIPNEDCL